MTMNGRGSAAHGPILKSSRYLRGGISFLTGDMPRSWRSFCTRELQTCGSSTFATPRNQATAHRVSLKLLSRDPTECKGHR